MSTFHPIGGVQTPSTSFRRIVVGGVAIAIATISLIVAPRAKAAVYYWSVTSGPWSVASNWSGVVPTSTDDAYIANGGTADITVSSEVCNNLFLGDPNSGTVLMSGGNLSAGQRIRGKYRQRHVRAKQRIE